MYTRGSCKTLTFWAGVPPPAADGDGNAWFCNRLTYQRCYDHRKSEDMYTYTQPQEQRNGSDGWTRTSNGRINGAVLYH